MFGFQRASPFLILLALLLRSRPLDAQLSVGHLKALVVEKVTRFIEWPSPSLPPRGPFVICLLGTDETAEGLARVATSRKWKNRPGSLRRLRPGAELTGCHLLHVSAPEEPRLPQILTALVGKPTLTVSNSAGFGQRGVLINLYEEGPFPRFEINLRAVKRSPLTFNSQLLKLGRLLD